MTELLVFGVDGLNHDYVQSMIDKTRMENFKRLQRHAQYGEMQSFVCEGYDVPHTGPMWTSLYTGLKPKEHGLMSGGWNDGDSEFHVMDTIWDKLGEEGKEMYLFGMPMTYKAKPINGKMVSGFVSPTLKSLWENCYYPSTLDLPMNFIKNTSSYVAKVKTDGATNETDSEEFLWKMREAEMNRLDAFKETHEDEDIVAYGTTLVDKIGHVAGIEEDCDQARLAYGILDGILGSLIRELNPDEIIIISDHGFSGFSHDLEGYYLNTMGPTLTDVFDFAPEVLKAFDIEYRQEHYGPTDNDSDLTESEIDDVKSQLEGLGYF